MDEASKRDLEEVMDFDPEEGIANLEQHLDRLKREAERQGFKFDRHAARNELQAATFELLVGGALLLEQARGRAEVEAGKIAVIGYCFGGQCALDVARAGADVAGVVSFHGLFDPPGLAPQPILAKVAAYHGWDDPMVPPEAVVALGNELTQAGADWQIHAYGGTMHSFTNPKAAMPDAGFLYSPVATARAWRSLEAFLDWFARGDVEIVRDAG